MNRNIKINVPEKSESVINPRPSCGPPMPLGTVQKDLYLFNFILNSSTTPIQLSDGTYTINNITDTKTIVAGDVVDTSHTDTNTNSNNISFNLTIPKFICQIPNFSIPSFPKIKLDNNGCNDCEEEFTIPVCDLQASLKKQCTKVLGVKACIWVPKVSFSKCFYEVYFENLELPTIKILELERTVMNIDFEILPEVEIDSDFSLGVTTTTVVLPTAAAKAATSGGKINSSTAFSNFKITKFKLGLSILIKNIEFTYKGKGLVLQNKKITLLPAIDYCAGEKYISATVDENGGINVFYDLLNRDFTLYDILAPILKTMDGNSIAPQYLQMHNNERFPTRSLYEYMPEIILNFFRRTDINYACGILICPLPIQTEPNYVSLWNKVKLQIYPFKDLNKVSDFKIPDAYYNVPDFPTISKYIVPKVLANQLNKLIDDQVNCLISQATNYVNAAQKFVTENLENIQVPIPKTYSISIIPKVTTLVGV